MREPRVSRGPRRCLRKQAATDRQEQGRSALSHRLRRTFGRAFVSALVIAIAVAGDAGFAAEPMFETSASMQSLDEQVQQIKSDVLAIAAELGNLEERLLYPSDTQIAVFVSLEDGNAIGLDSARISIDGELVAHHIYSFKELEALEKGGVQRIYTGNVRTGEHQIEVAIAGTRSGGKDFKAVESFLFSKEVEPKLVGITLGSETSGDAKITVEGW